MDDDKGESRLIYPLVVEAFSKPPNATILIIMMALGVNLLYSVGRRLLTNVERSRRMQAELKAYQKELREAILSKNKAKEERLRKKKKQMNEIQMKVTMENLRVTALFLVPLMVLWWIMQQVVGEGIVALSPIPINLLILAIPPELNLFWWYMISSFAFSGVISRAFGVGLTD